MSFQFLLHTVEDLALKLKPLGEQERAVILKLKEQESQKRNLPFTGELHAWDTRYYMTQVEETQYAVDQNQLKEYFPMEVVTKGLLNIYQELLNLTFQQVEGAAVWHDDVSLYCVKDRTSGQVVGQFYLDLFPRWALILVFYRFFFWWSPGMGNLNVLLKLGFRDRNRQDILIYIFIFILVFKKYVNN